MEKLGQFTNEVFKVSPLGMTVTDYDGIIMRINPSSERLFFRAAEGKSFYTNIFKEDAQTLRNNIINLIEGNKESIRFDARFYKDGNKYGWCRLFVSAVFSAYLNSNVLLFISEDITGQIVLEKQLKKAKSLAEQQKTTALSAQLEAEKATKTKSEFLANMSHEIRTPIHTIIGMSELLNETALDAEQKEYTGQIMFSAEVLLSLINDILDVEKIESGKLKLENIEMDLLEVAHSAVDLIALEAHKKHLEASLYIEPDVPHLVFGDPTRLRQIVVNLFNNAMKFTESGEIELRISLAEDSEDDALILFRVRDTGIGIPADKMNVLFREFSQVDSSTTRKYGGTGLGLTISKNLSRIMGGEIGVESESGQGSVFWFTARFKKQKEESLFISYRDSHSGELVLVVDDNDTARLNLSAYLSELGCSVEQASSGAKALEMLKGAAASEHPYSACFIDQIMPGMDGWYMASEINSLRSDPAFSSLNQLKMYLVSPSGRGAEEAKMKLLQWFSGYLNKPVKKEQLFSVFAGMQTAAEEDEACELLPLDDDIDTGRPLAIVAEDHEVNQQLFKAILVNLGCDVVVASNGLEAVESVKEAAPDIIFMDCQMPEMNGYEASTEIRRLGFDAPIVAVTASAIKGEREKCFASGMSDFLTKPFKKKDIDIVLSKWRGKRHEAAVEEASVEPAPNIQKEPEPDMSDIFDFKEAVDTFLGNEQTVRKLINDYVKKVDGQIPDLSSALAADKLETGREIAHSIKGSALNLEMKQLGEAAKELEYSCRDGQSELSESNYKSLLEAFTNLKDYLSENGFIGSDQ